MSKIVDFMRLCLNKKEIPLSWSVSNIVVSKGKVSFDVYASKYQGEVKIHENKQRLIVKLRNRIRIFSSSKELFYWLDESME